MLKKRFFYLFFLAFNFLNSQNNSHTISGYIMSAESNEIVIGANIIIPKLNTGTITNSYGFYSITIREGTYKLEISSIGFKTK